MTSPFSQVPAGLPRRAFLRVAGASAATAGLVLAGCGKTDTPPVVNSNILYLGSTSTSAADVDAGLLNYFFLLKQLEAAFYQRVVDALPTDLPPAERAFFSDLRDHELVHRETLRYALGNRAYDAAAAQPLPFDFSSLTLTTRAGVLAAAQQLEDLGVAAYAGALRLVRTPDLVALVAKMSSVEARHAALLRDLRTPGSFAGDDVVVNAGVLQSVSLAKTPAQVIAEAKAFFLPIVVSTDLLPTA
ncbi:ferritin-like domain-containing protein [Hymenobacter sp. BT664]|uniref:Ferritin-like domain-containing protein n=1 Tax=Hymenobacter montanus TaxID=2771359 RepID=A0A927BAG5_9BACT|nr:ferritin-like domain-containing protein [Hymenobacter montanus]MBD2767091.1 ferritin-like domain-containing protein [Hymenobacter montanus]